MCFVVLLGWLLPRVTLTLLWLLTEWTAVLTPWWLGLLGFLFLPYTTLAYVLVRHWAGPVDLSSFAHIVPLVVGVLLDAGAWHGGRRAHQA